MSKVTFRSSLPRSVLTMMQPRSAISTSFSTSSRSGLAAETRSSMEAKRAGESARVAITSVLTSEISALRALMAARRLLMKQPATEARRSDRPSAPRRSRLCRRGGRWGPGACLWSLRGGGGGHLMEMDFHCSGHGNVRVTISSCEAAVTLPAERRKTGLFWSRWRRTASRVRHIAHGRRANRSACVEVP